jgi:two-component system CheB/CheR fusion protein
MQQYERHDECKAAWNCNVLVVDDNHDAADSIVMFLELHTHYNVRAAYTPKQAHNMTKDWKPDVVLMDIGLPEKHGYELAVEFKQRYPWCKFVAVTGHATADFHQRSKLAGFTHHLVKPVDAEVLEQIVREDCQKAHLEKI